MKIACIGNVTYDLTVIGEQFIKEGGKSSFNEATFTVGGPASNAYYVINKFNKNNNVIHFYGQIGNDTNGVFIYNNLLENNCDVNHINRKDNFFTPFSYIIINKNNSTRTICSLRDKKDFANPHIESIDFETGYDYILTDGKYVDDTIELIKKNPQAITIIDAGRVNEGILKLCNVMDYIICSEEFASEVTGIETGNKVKDMAVYDKLSRIFRKAKGITVTLGGRGYVCDGEDNTIVNAAYNTGKKAIDTNGAGDIFHGAFTYALANSYSYHDSLKFANITAALSTTKVGGRRSCPNLDEVEKIFGNNTDYDGPSKSLIK